MSITPHGTVSSKFNSRAFTTPNSMLSITPRGTMTKTLHGRVSANPHTYLSTTRYSKVILPFMTWCSPHLTAWCYDILRHGALQTSWHGVIPVCRQGIHRTYQVSNRPHGRMSPRSKSECPPLLWPE